MSALNFAFALLVAALLLPRAYGDTSPCRYVTVRAKFGEKSGSQGVGWAIQDGKRSFILTPAHVTRGAKNAQARCGDAIAPLTLVASSATYDLAVYSLSSALPLNPVLDTGSARKPEEIWTAPNIDDRARGESGLVSYQVQGAQIAVPYVGNEQKTTIIFTHTRKFTATGTILEPHPFGVYLGSAIRPGMSGSAVYIYNSAEENPLSSSRLPVAMAVKVAGNSNSSYAIPTVSILQLLPSLISGSDPWRKASPTLPYIEYVKSDVAQVTTKSIVFPADGLKLTDACPQGLASTSVGGNWADGGGNWADGGGNWADGGDGSSTAFDLISEKPNQESTILSTFFKWSPTCKEVGLRLPDGRLLTGLNRSAAIKSVEESFGYFLRAAREGTPQGAKIIQQYGVFSTDEAATKKLFCHSDTLGRQGELWLGRSSFISSTAFSSRTVIELGKGFHPKSLAMLRHRDKRAGTVSCSKSAVELDLDFGTIEGVGPIHLRLSRAPRYSTGSLRVGLCTVKISQPELVLWNTRIQDPKTGLDALLSLGPVNDGLSMAITSLPEFCRLGLTTQPISLLVIQAGVHR